MKRHCVVSVFSEIHAVHVSFECYLSCTICGIDMQKLIPGSHLSALLNSVGSVDWHHLRVHLWGVGSSYLSRERHRNGVAIGPLAVTLNSGPFHRDTGDSSCQQSIAVAVAGWERVRERDPGSSVATP